MTEPSVPFWPTILSCRCPRCGRGKLFSGLLALEDRCRACDLDLGQSDTGDANAVLIIILLGAIIGGLAIWTEFKFEPRWWVHVLIWPTVTIPAAIGLMRLSKSLMIAMQFKHRSNEMGV